MKKTISFDELMQRMLDRVPDTVDKREGSIIYDALAPVAVELVQFYIEMASSLNLGFVDSSEGEYLTRVCRQFGIERLKATYAVRKGIFKGVKEESFNVPIGSRYTIETLAYTVVRKIAEGEYELQCEKEGEVGNTYFGKMIPIDYIEGLATATLNEVLIPGTNEENDTKLKQRYYEYIREPAFGGNIADYKRKVKTLEGIGAVKVLPVWNGSGTVKLVLLDSMYAKPSTTLISKVKQAVDPMSNQFGLGIAPIGHVVTVVGADEVAISISTHITLKDGYTLESMKQESRSVLNNYFLSLRETWEENENIIVRLAHIESKLLDIEGVIDIENTKINNQIANLTLNNISIPILGELIVL